MGDDAEPSKLRLGGMALRNGVLVHGPAHWAVAVRDRPDGAPIVRSGAKSTVRARLLRRSKRAPVLRGVAALADAVLLLPRIRRQAPEARLPMDAWRTRAATAGALLGGVALRRGGPRTAVAREAAGLVLATVPALISLRDGQVTRFHAAEHQAIAAYETGEPATHTAKEHDRCGTNLLVPTLVATVAANMATSRLPLGRRARSAAGAAGSAVAIGAVMEAWSWAVEHADTALGRAMLAPGRLLQARLTTVAPSADELELGPLAVAAVVAAERPT